VRVSRIHLIAGGQFIKSLHPTRDGASSSAVADSSRVIVRLALFRVRQLKDASWRLGLLFVWSHVSF